MGLLRDGLTLCPFRGCELKVRASAVVAEHRVCVGVGFVPRVVPVIVGQGT